MKLKTILYGGEELSPKQEKIRKFFMYLVSGGITTVVNFISFYLFDVLVTAEVNVKVFSYNLDLMLLLNQFIAWFLAVISAYFLNRIFVFLSKGSILRELLSFAAARVLSFIVIEWGLFTVMLAIAEKGMGIPQDSVWFSIGSFDVTCLYVVKILDSVILVIANYVMSKLMVFRKEDCVDYSKEGTEDA